MITDLQSRAATAEAALDVRYTQGRADEHAALVSVIDTAAQVPRLQAELARTRQVGGMCVFWLGLIFYDMLILAAASESLR